MTRGLNSIPLLFDSTLEENSATEIRLLKEHKLQPNELFRTPEEIIEDAYQRQGKKWLLL